MEINGDGAAMVVAITKAGCRESILKERSIAPQLREGLPVLVTDIPSGPHGERHGRER